MSRQGRNLLGFLALGYVAYLFVALVLLYFESSLATPMMALGVLPPLALGLFKGLLSGGADTD